MLGRPISSWIVAGLAIFTLAMTRDTIVHASTLGDTTSTALLTAILASAVLALVPSRWAAVAILGWIAIDGGMSLVWIGGSRTPVALQFVGIALRGAVLAACAFHIWKSLTGRE